MPADTPLNRVFTLLWAAARIELHGLHTGGPNFADPTGRAADVPLSLYWAAHRTNRPATPFTIPTIAATEDAKTLITAHPLAAGTIRTLAGHLDPDWLDDPIERLAHWPTLPGITATEVTGTLRDLAYRLTLTAVRNTAAA